jgi:hypothetical protein
MPLADEKSMRRPLLALALSILLGGFAAAPVLLAQDTPLHAPPHGQAQSPPRPWQSLDADQRAVLAPMQKDWDSLPPQRQQHMLEKAARWVKLPEAQREEIRQRITRWQQMSPAEREDARRNMRKFKDLTDEQREQLHAAFDRFRQLPPDQREALIQKWQKLSPAERQQSLHQLGPNSVLPPPPPSPDGR